MASLHIRQPFAAAFVVLLLVSAYLGLSTPKIPSYGHSDKGLHFIAFFLLTLTFYWIFDTSRRQVINLTLLICTVGGSIGSEFIQALIPSNTREFDPYDIVANFVGSALALALCSWYHRRMLERRRKNRTYDIVPGEEDLGVDGERDVELGEGIGGTDFQSQETGVISSTQHDSEQQTNVTQELDNWDENDEDWDDGADNADSRPDESTLETKKRTE